MRCPYCGDVENRVIDSRLGRDGEEIRRRRECAECARRFTTRERVDLQMPKIIKRDERREDYKRDKLEGSIQKACAKRPVSENGIQTLVDRVERSLQETTEAEVPTAFLGDAVLAELVRLDGMAAARFASVFRRFERAEDYERFFEKEIRPSGSDEAGSRSEE